eukprot:6203653-Pleurochrysis_carterae.AAC.1
MQQKIPTFVKIVDALRVLGFQWRVLDAAACCCEQPGCPRQIYKIVGKDVKFHHLNTTRQRAKSRTLYFRPPKATIHQLWVFIMQ